MNKRILSLVAVILVVCSLFTLAGCGNQVAQQEESLTDQTESLDPGLEEEEEKEVLNDEKEPETKPASKPQQTQQTQQSKPVEKPAEKPVEKPAEKPAEKPETQPTTVGEKLLAEFKKIAGSGDALSIANTLSTNKLIPFSAMASNVVPGLLSGFDNAEIKGFKDGATFGPMIGSIAFIGYVFELENGTNASDFIATLKANANLRWNICVEAEEMVAGSSGNKVFFVMCPKDFED